MSSSRVLARTGRLSLSSHTTLSQLRPLSRLHLRTTKVSATSGSAIQASKRTYSSSARGYFTTTVEDGQDPAETEPLAIFKPLDTFARRHIGPKTEDANKMLETLGYKSLDEFVKDVIPGDILSSRDLKVSPELGYSETALIERLKEIAKKNVVDKKSFIGTGYYGTITPPVIQRNILECPEWYTSYTPYQPEISQGRLESLINFQTVATDLTGLAIANASVLDEATAAAEAMTISWGSLPASRQKRPNKTYFVDEKVHPQTLDGLRSRAEGFGINIKVGNALEIAEIEKIGDDLVGVLVQYPSTDGSIHDYSALSEKVHGLGGTVAVATDLLALTLLKPPAEFGADIAFGNAQRFGVPMGYGGPHAAFFATSEKYKRKMPGRLIGLSKDRLGNPAYRLALQTREQHIRREKATSNICTAQALLANMSAMYAVYHGPEGLKKIAKRVHAMAEVVAEGFKKMGYMLKGGAASEGGFFDTVVVEVADAESFVQKAAKDFNLNLRTVDSNTVGVSLDETVGIHDVVTLLAAFNSAAPAPQEVGTTFLTTLSTTAIKSAFPEKFVRTSSFLTHPVFNSYHSETEMLRYIHHLQSKDLSLAHSMIPLGSCTMKLNATTEMLPITWPEFSTLHPFVPKDQAQGYAELIGELEADLANITGFDAVSLQPNSGAQGEFTGLRVIREYLKSNGQGHRDICLIPVSAHGTNPASATMAGLKVVPVKCDSKTGNLDLADLEAKAKKYKDNLAAFMVTYPSTFGVFEPGVKRALEIVHENGGQVYMDGANMNAQVGLCSPGEIGADVCHLNLHKTFCIPHGGGGPGVGPIGVKSHLAPFLPGHSIIATGGEHAIPAISAAPWGSASILPISWSYVKLMGARGLTHATKITLLNANYMAARLAPHYPILYTNTKSRCAHEFILDVRPLAQSAGIEAIDIAKRLQDYGFHAPTMSWPVSGTLMIEPTESESKEELDRFCDTLIAIREEIRDIEEGKQPKKDNVLKMSPHTAQDLLGEWNRSYSREKAAYPLKYLRERKFWPTVTRIDDAYGDMNLFCTCSPVDPTE